MTTEVKLSQKLKETREELLEIRKEVNVDIRFLEIVLSTRIRHLLQNIEIYDNKKLKDTALSTICIVCTPKKAFCSKYSYASKFLIALDNMVKTIDAELPKEERIDLLAENILNCTVTIPNEEKFSFLLEEVIHRETRKVAHILVEVELENFIDPKTKKIADIPVGDIK